MSRGDRSSAPTGLAGTRAAAGNGLETAADGTVIGRDPRRLSPKELRELGHRGKPLLQAIRRRCIDCGGGKKDEVRRCTAVACPLWPYRMGTDPWRAEPAKPAGEGRPAAPAPAAPALAPAAPAATPAKAPEPMEASVPAPAFPVTARRRNRRVLAETPRLPFLDGPA